MKLYHYFVAIIFAMSSNSILAQNDNRITKEQLPADVQHIIDSVDNNWQMEREVMALKRIENKHNLLEGMTSDWYVQGAWNNSKAPSQQYLLNFGKLNNTLSSGYWAGGFSRSLRVDDQRKWGVGYALDWMRMFGTGDHTRQLNQLYVEGRYRGFVATLGMKQQMEDLGLGRLPLMQLRLSTHGYQPLYGKLFVKANVAYGLTTGQIWNQIFIGAPHEGFHEKQAVSGGLYLRLGRPLMPNDSRPMGITIETGVQTGMAARDDWKDFTRWASTLSLHFKRSTLSFTDTRFFGVTSCMWSPLYFVGKDFQGVALSLHPEASLQNPMPRNTFAISLAQHRLKNWNASLGGTTPIRLSYNLRYTYRPMTIRPLDVPFFKNNMYIDSDIRHAWYANLTYELPIPHVPGISFTTAYAWDMRKDGLKDVKGIQLFFNWKRPITFPTTFRK